MATSRQLLADILWPLLGMVLPCAAVASGGEPVRGASSTPEDLVNGVSQVCCDPYSPGPVYTDSAQWQAIISGDDDSTFPSTFVIARSYGAGAVVMLGSESLLVTPSVLDNGTFLLNMVRFLDRRGLASVRFTIGHAEWANVPAAGLASLLTSNGYSVNTLSGVLSATSLAGTSVLVIGNAWGDFTPGEIEAVRQFVQAGGGLCLAGLGWSWDAYNPGLSFEDYPMMKMAAPYEARWLKSSIWDPTDNQNGSPVFHTFYPNCPSPGVADAMAIILAAHAAHPTDLPDALESDAALSLAVTRAHRMLAMPAAELPAGDPLRHTVYDFYATLAATWPGIYAKVAPLDPGQHPTSAWLRERVWRTWCDCLPLTPAVKAEIASAGHLSGGRFDLLNRFNVILMDNMALDTQQTTFLVDLLGLIPADLYKLRSISVVDALGAQPPLINLEGTQYGVNIFGFPIGSIPENSFPDDIEPGIIDVYSAVAVHEINHVVDATTVGWSGQLANGRAALIAQANNDSMNYLRSMFPGDFFANAPQEFFASISNQWFTNTTRVLELGVSRFDAGRPDPLNQALYFAEVYSQGGPATWGYHTDTAGHITRQRLPIHRDPFGRIDGLAVGPYRYHFHLDDPGNVTAYTLVPPVDFDLDGDVDGADGAIFAACKTGPSIHYNPAALPEGCTLPPDTDGHIAADLDGDGDVDQGDFGIYQRCYGGPDVPADAACMD